MDFRNLDMEIQIDLGIEEDVEDNLKNINKEDMKNVEENITSYDLDFLKVRDIIWAKRYKTLKEKEQIPEGHREGPYVVVYIAKGKVYALECVSNKADKAFNPTKLKYDLGANPYLKKGGYVYVGKLVHITKDRFVKKLGPMAKEDFNKTLKYLYLLKNVYKNTQLKIIPNEKINFEYSIGDIVLYNNRPYYIHGIDKKHYLCYQVLKNTKHVQTIEINYTNYAFNFFSDNKILKDSKIKLIDIVDEDKQKKISIQKEVQLKRRNGITK